MNRTLRRIEMIHRGGKSSTRIVLGATLAGFLFGVAPIAHASLTLLDRSGWKVKMGGFVEVDSITDSTRSFNEMIGNTPVSRDAQNGNTGRDQLSIRNSRLAFTILAPEVDGWKPNAYFEFDLLGYDPAPGSSNSEGGFYNNPTLRLRHGFIGLSKEGWTLMAGQYWNLLGWQPYYFIPTVQVAPIPAMLYDRTSQVRATRSVNLGNEFLGQLALGVMRPPQRDSSLPGLETGIRLAYTGRTGYLVGGTSGLAPMPLSIAVSGAVREFDVAQNIASPTGAQNPYTGHAIAMDAFLPVLPAHGTDAGNSLSFGGEFTTGSGDGDEFSSWSGGMYSPLSTGPSPNSNLALDSGIGGFDPSSDFHLVDVKTFNVYGQYFLPTQTHAWISGGFGRLYSDNVGTLSQSFTSTTSCYDKEQIAFANIMRDFTENLRLGFEVAQIQTQYLDGTLVHDNRYQLSGWLFF